MSKPKRKTPLLSRPRRMAVTRILRVSPQKLNLVAAAIRGKKVDKALAELTFSRKRIAGDGQENTRIRRLPTPRTIMISTSTRWSWRRLLWARTW